MTNPVRRSAFPAEHNRMWGFMDGVYHYCLPVFPPCASKCVI